MQEMQLNFSLNTTCKKLTKMAQRPTCKTQNYKILSGKLYNVRFGNDFLHIIPKGTGQRERTYKLDLMKI